jgi:hypothetical protein
LPQLAYICDFSPFVIMDCDPGATNSVEVSPALCGEREQAEHVAPLNHPSREHPVAPDDRCARQERYNTGMRQALRLHPDSLCLAATRIEAEIARPRPGCLALCYFVSGNMEDIRLPPALAPARADELWRHTCFEAFIRANPGAGYYEFNFAPSAQWAAYWFSSYRSGMRVATEINAPRIEVRSGRESFALQALLELDGLTSLRRDAVWQAGLSAVIEETSGRKSYWALAHPPGKADFHHPVCFAHELSPASRP